MTLADKHKRFLAPGIAALALTLGGCVSKDMTDLENYVSEVLARKGGRIEPLPPIKPYERYLYQAEELGLRNPFRSFMKEEAEIASCEGIS